MARNRSLRERKERKLYSDDWALGDEEIEGYHTFDLHEKMNTDKFSGDFVKDMSNVDFDLSYFQKNGFSWPLLFKTKEKLGIVVPNSDFTVNDVRAAVGSRRMLDVMDVNTQKNVEMTMKDWTRYYESKDKDKLLNVISLEFSHTKLEHAVEAPTVVRQIDWVEKVWPRHLKEAQTESTNVLEDMMYPKVQKYCLMSVGGCYTDFHIDFGGTSVWYHILRGRKIFWLIPPTENNLQLYEQWVLSGKQGDVFFGDTVEKCERLELFAGNTFFIPTGWIHAVFTPEDSLVFGGNFLHSYGIEKQLRVAQVEDTTHVPQKFRYPFFTEMLWYVLERYVHVLLGRTHLSLPPSEHEKLLVAVKNENKTVNNNSGDNDPESKHVHLTRYELHGLKAIVMYLHSLPNSRKNVPDLVTDPVPLIQDVKTLVELHRFDRPELAMTRKPVLEWWHREPVRFGIKRPSSEGLGAGPKKSRGDGGTSIAGPRVLPPNATKVRYRRTRCKKCDACNRDDCRVCSFCLDMSRYGGSGVLKQRCKYKKCEQPMLPALAVCYLCGLDGHMLSPHDKKVKDDSPSTLMECSICYKVSHTNCHDVKDDAGIIHEDYPNSWDCPECLDEGYDKAFRPLNPKARLSTATSDSSDNQGVNNNGLSAVKKQEEDLSDDLHHTSQTSSLMPCPPPIDTKPLLPPPPPPPTINQEDGVPVPHPMPSWEQLQARVSRPLVRPQWVVRPVPLEVTREDALLLDEEDESSPSKKPKKPAHLCGTVLRTLFKYLPRNDLVSAMRVCRDWAKWSIHPSLWQHITLPPNEPVTAIQLEGIVRRQPNKLTLNWVPISQEQLLWLLTRLPQLKEVDFEGLSWGELRVLGTCFSPPLQRLNLNFCEGIDATAINLLLSPPVCKRPGFRNAAFSRMASITHLSLANAFIGDDIIKKICTELNKTLVHLDLSHCFFVTDETIAMIADICEKTFKSLDLRRCNNLRPFCLPELSRLKKLVRLGLAHCRFIPEGAIRAWANSNSFKDSDGLLIKLPSDVRDAQMALESQVVRTTFTDTIKSHIRKRSENADLVANTPDFNKQTPSTSKETDIEKSEDIDDNTETLNTTKRCSDKEYECRTDDDLEDDEQLNKSLDRSSVHSTKSDLDSKSEATKESTIESASDDEDEEYSEMIIPRARRRPSRYAESSTRINSPVKSPKKKMKQVMVELEDINVRSKHSTKISVETKVSNESKIKTHENTKETTIGQSDTSKSTIESFPIISNVRRLPRKNRSAELQDKDLLKSPTSKMKDNSDTKDDLNDKNVSPANKRPSSDVQHSDESDTVEPVKEKDIVTRSKRLKVNPTKTAAQKVGIVPQTGLKSPRVLVSRKEVEHSPEKLKMTLDLSKVSKLKPAKQSTPTKRSRSSSSDQSPSPTKKLVKDQSLNYSSKLRKKSSDGSCAIVGKVFPENELPRKEEVSGSRIRRSLSKADNIVVDQDESLDSQTSINQIESQASSRSARKRSESSESNRSVGKHSEIIKKSSTKTQETKKSGIQKRELNLKVKSSKVDEDAGNSTRTDQQEAIQSSSCKGSNFESVITRDTSNQKSSENVANKTILPPRKQLIRKSSSDKIIYKKKESLKTDQLKGIANKLEAPADYSKKFESKHRDKKSDSISEKTGNKEKFADCLVSSQSTDGKPEIKDSSATKKAASSSAPASPFTKNKYNSTDSKKLKKATSKEKSQKTHSTLSNLVSVKKSNSEPEKMKDPNIETSPSTKSNLKLVISKSRLEREVTTMDNKKKLSKRISREYLSDSESDDDLENTSSQRQTSQHSRKDNSLSKYEGSSNSDSAASGKNNNKSSLSSATTLKISGDTETKSHEQKPESNSDKILGSEVSKIKSGTKPKKSSEFHQKEKSDAPDSKRTRVELKTPTVDESRSKKSEKGTEEKVSPSKSGDVDP